MNEMLKELREKLIQYRKGDFGRDALKEWLSTKPCEKWVLSILDMDAEEIIALEMCDRLLHNIEPDPETFNRVVSKIIMAIEKGCIEKVCFYKATKLLFSENERRVLDIAERICNQALYNNDEVGIAAFNECDISFLENMKNTYYYDYYLLNRPKPRKSILEILVFDLALMLYDIYYINQCGSSDIPSVKVPPDIITRSDKIKRISYITGFLTGEESAYIHICGQNNNFCVYLL